MPTLEKSIDKPAPIKLEYHPTIHDMPTDERPRERLKHYGPQALANAELLAIILRTGTTRDNVVELASKLLTKYGGLSGLMRAELGELCAEYGLGEAKAAQLKAALEIGRRLGRLQPDEKYQIKSPADAANLVMMENHNWSDIKGSPSAPYINTTLLPMASHAEQYYNPPGIHPSEPNYLWLEAGTNFGIANDNPPSSNHQSTTSHLVTLLTTAGISWKTYQENITGTTCPLTDSYPYAVKHNPFVYFDDVTTNQSPSSTT